MKGLPFKIPHKSQWLLADSQFDPDEISPHTIQLIKERPHRKVYKLGDIYLKAYKRNLPELLFNRDMAKKEFILSRILFEKKRAPSPVGYARSGRWSLFAAKKVCGENLLSFMESQWNLLSKRKKRELLKKFSILLHDLSDMGIMQRDFHLENIFFHTKLWDFVLIDLQRAEYTGAPLSQVAACEQLRYVLPPFSRFLNRQELLIALSYVSKWLPGVRNQNSRFFLQELAYKDIRRHTFKKFKRKAPKQFKVEKKDDYSIFKKKKIDENPVDDAICNFLATLKEGKMPSCVKIIKDSRHTLCLDYEAEKTRLFIKCYRGSSHLKRISYLFRQPRAVSSWYLSFKLERLGINTPLPLFAIQGKNPWRPLYGLVAFPWISEMEKSKKNAVQFLQKEDSRKFFLRNLALFIWDMHQKGVFHGDCKLTNFVVYPNGDKFMIFDLDSTKVFKSDLPDRCRIKDVSIMCRSLGRLNLSWGEAAQEEFLKSYCRVHLPWKKRYKEILPKLKGV